VKFSLHTIFPHAAPLQWSRCPT